MFINKRILISIKFSLQDIPLGPLQYLEQHNWIKRELLVFLSMIHGFYPLKWQTWRRRSTDPYYVWIVKHSVIERRMKQLREIKRCLMPRRKNWWSWSKERSISVVLTYCLKCLSKCCCLQNWINSTKFLRSLWLI